MPLMRDVYVVTASFTARKGTETLGEGERQRERRGMEREGES